MDLFQTTADQNFNSFQSPLNPFNTTQGAWNIDPTYLTPSYAAPYRPQYQGPFGAPPSPYNVGMGTAARNLFTPFGDYRPYGNSINQEDPYFSALTQRPMDAAAWTGQRVIAPALAFYAGMKASGIAMRSNSATYTSVMTGLRQIGGMSPGQAAAKSARMGVGARLGSSVGQGMASGISGGLSSVGIRMGTTASAGLAGGLGLAGAGLGSLLTPLLIGEGLMTAYNSTIADPYAASRNTANSLRDNFSNVHLGGGGNPITGFGISRENAAHLANNLTRTSIHDMMLDTKGMGDLTDFAARSGMLDSSQMDQIESKMKAITKSIKVMMRVANEPDFRAAMEMLSELRVSGAGPEAASRVLARIGGSSAVSGISAQKMMNTVGAQGQYLYQANGMTPYLGQVHAANTYGAFSSAYRMGLISDSTMAKFGGREGITQLAMTGQINATQTPYNQIMLMNQYLHGGQSGSVVGNLAKFGGMAALDPLAAQGALSMYEHEFSSRQLMEKGPLAVMDQLNHIARTIPGMVNRNGKIDVEKAHLLMTKQMGLSDMESKAMLKELYAVSNPKSLRHSMSALAGNQLQDTIKTLDQEGLNYGVATGAMYGIRSAWKNAKSGVSDVFNAPIEIVGSAGDRFQKWFYGAQYGSLIDGVEAESFEDFMGGSVPSRQELVSKESPLDSLAYYAGRAIGIPGQEKVRGGFDRINELARSGNALARKIVDPKTSESEKRAALEKLNVTGKLGDSRLTPQEVKALSTRVLKAESKSVASEGSTASLGKLEAGLEKTLGRKVGLLEGAEVLKALKNIHTGKVKWEDSDQSIALARKALGGDLSFTELAWKAKEVTESSMQNQVAHLPANMAGMSSDDIIRAARRGDKSILGGSAGSIAEEIRKIESDTSLSASERKRRIEAAAMFGISKASGQSLTSPFDSRNIPSGLDADAVARLTESREEAAKHMHSLTKMANQGSIEFDTKYSSMAAIKLDQAVNTFGEFVNKFGEAANKFAEASGVESDDGPSLFSKAWNEYSPFKSSSTGE